MCFMSCSCSHCTHLPPHLTLEEINALPPLLREHLLENVPNTLTGRIRSVAESMLYFMPVAFCIFTQEAKELRERRRLSQP